MRQCPVCHRWWDGKTCPNCNVDLMSNYSSEDESDGVFIKSDNTKTLQNALDRIKVLERALDIACVIIESRLSVKFPAKPTILSQAEEELSDADNKPQKDQNKD